jgi:hypothetical protein
MTGLIHAILPQGLTQDKANATLSEGAKTASAALAALYGKYESFNSDLRILAEITVTV